MFCLACLAALGGCGVGDRTDVLILVREGDPVSRSIARAYAEARRIPAENILSLALSTEAGAQEIDAARYVTEIAQPIEAYLAANDPDHEIQLLVSTRGLPWRIGHCAAHSPRYPLDCESAALDAALAQLGRAGVPAAAAASSAASSASFGRSENPYFRDPRSFDAFRRSQPGAALRFLVARLEAPLGEGDAPGATPHRLRKLLERPAPDEAAGPETIRWRISSSTPRADRSAPTAALLDPIAPQLVAFGQEVCDGCDDAPAPASALERDPALPARPAPPPLPIHGVVLQTGDVDAPRPSGPAVRTALARPGFVIRLDGTRLAAQPGRPNPVDPFLSHWLDRGAGAISFHLGEPSLADVTRPTALISAFARGDTAIEAHWKSVPQLGSMNVFVGDPLLRLPEDSIFVGGERDQDLDGVPDDADNCPRDPNPDQRDTNRDGFGNRCDPDVDNDGDVDTSWGAIYPVDQRGDLEAISLTIRNGPPDPDHDLDGDGQVDERDLVHAQLWLFRSPGR